MSRIEGQIINDQKNKDKSTNNDLQNTTQKTKYWATQTHLKAGDELRCSGSNTKCYTNDE